MVASHKVFKIPSFSTKTTCLVVLERTMMYWLLLNCQSSHHSSYSFEQSCRSIENSSVFVCGTSFVLVVFQALQSLKTLLSSNLSLNKRIHTSSAIRFGTFFFHLGLISYTYSLSAIAEINKS